MIRFLTALALLFAATPAVALESARAVSPRATVSLVSDSDTVAPGVPMRLGLLIRLTPGWHTYWKNPGDAGAPAELRLELPPGVAAGPLTWPTPEPLREGPLLTYAYTQDVLLPLTVTARAGFAANATADWLVCKDICVPEHADFHLTLPEGRPTPSAEAPLFAAADRAIPRASPWTARIATDGVLSVAGPELGPATVARARFMPDKAGVIDDAAAQTLRVAPGALSLTLAPGAGFRAGEGLSGVLVVRDRAGLATNVTIHATSGPPPPILAPTSASLWRLWGLAFLGGVILNLMPCVFPVLALKAIGLARGVRAHAWSYTAGILAAFAAMGGAVMAVRTSGGDWGFQFASPAFVAATAWVMLAIGLNLSGVFRVGAGALGGAGQGVVARGGHLGSFATGLLAVLVATPCTAPFMAVAVAGALAAPPVATLSVFLAMGLGLAAPYVALTYAPGLARRLPRPGRWMEWLRKVLAFPMYATAAWLVWVLSQEAGPEGLLAGLAGFVLVGGAAWLVGATQTEPAWPRRLGAGLAGVAVVIALALLPRIQGDPAAARVADGAEAFSPTRLAVLRAEGRPVFVDMTAAWCVTCLVNERVAIDTDAVRNAFAVRDVAYLKGDWTRQDPALTGFLRENGRDGVPLYLFYPAHAPAPVMLPQILTAGTVLTVLGAG
ncbi:MAG: protein-disulfide reductase DsbD domain-containing protein [Acetobacteraceae bacterium]